MTKSSFIAIYEKIKIQRAKIIAPVDNLGCHAFTDENPNKRKLKIFVGLLLSSQTKDSITHGSVLNLENKLEGGLTLASIRSAKTDFIDSCISKVGFHNKKAIFLKKIANLVDNEIPETLEELIKLPGIGYKMALLYLFHGCGKMIGIGVDTHVHRISNRIGLISKTPNETRILLERELDIEEWKCVNNVLVGFGQMICLPVKPKCDICAAKEICPSAKFTIKK